MIAAMKLLVLEEPRFTCSTCATGCRNWHVELLSDEIARVKNLAWPAGDPLVGVVGVMQHAGRTYLAHAPDGVCVFLNRSNNLCRIHAEFGVDVKPLGCRLYPFQIAPTFEGEATISPRYTCPTVRKNIGVSHREALPELRELAAKMQLPGYFDQATTCNLDRDQTYAVCEFAATLMSAFPQNDQRALFLIALCDFLSSLTADELDREELARAFAPIKAGVEAVAAAPGKKVGWFTRLAFRMYLGLHLRRDEDVLDGRAGRLQRVTAMMAFVAGRGGFSGLGVVHPTGTLSKSRLFRPELSSNDASLFELHWRMISTKLMSLHFMGSANHGRDLLAGLRSLALLYPLVASAAKYRAGNRGSTAIETEDVDYAVGVIEHNFGRSRVLAQPFARAIEKLLLDPDVFVRVVRGI
jgi:Fe-S-cluster containining protein